MTGPTEHPAPPCAVRTAGLGKRYGRTWAVRDLDLRIRPGTVFGLLGPNGAGKSTTIRLLLGLARPSRGRAEVFGVDAADVVRAHRHLAHVPADVALWPHLSGAQVLHLLAATGPGTDTAYRGELVERFGLDPSERAGSYSTGNRQKVALVAAFATRAPLLVLDEPTSGLDPLVEREFRRAVLQARDRGQTVLLSSHRLDEVEAVCDEVGIVRAGRLVEAGPLAELRGLHRTEVSATFTGPEPRLAGLPGVSVLEATAPCTGPGSAPGRVRFTVTGSPGAALAALAGAGVGTLSVREPSLEEVFLDHYGQGGPEGSAPGSRR